MNTTQPQHLYSSSIFFFFFFFLPHYPIIEMADKQCLISHCFHILHYTTLSSPKLISSHLTLIHLFTRHFWFFVNMYCMFVLSVCPCAGLNWQIPEGPARPFFVSMNDIIFWFYISQFFNFHVYVNNYISFLIFLFHFQFHFCSFSFCFLFVFFLFCLATILSNGENWCGCRCQNLIY